jgi:hypothetical protein
LPVLVAVSGCRLAKKSRPRYHNLAYRAVVRRRTLKAGWQSDKGGVLTLLSTARASLTFSRPIG